MLLDPHYAYPRGVTLLDASRGMILTLEDSLFRETPGGRLSAEIDDWSVEKIKRMGGDAVKVLTWYRPDADPAVCRAQQEFTRSASARPARATTSRSCSSCWSTRWRSDAEQTTEYVEMTDQEGRSECWPSVETSPTRDYGVDVFKLESPVAAANVRTGSRGLG